MVPLLLPRAAFGGALAGALPTMARAAQDSLRPPAHESIVGAGVELWAD